MSKPSLVVIGGGYVGCEVAAKLEQHFDVTLIEPKTAFVHAPAMIRALVTPDLLDEALIPYDQLLSRGRIVHDKAESVSAAGVKLLGGETVAADYIVIATGSSNGLTFKPQTDDIAEFRTAHAETHAKLQQAKRVVIVGAGAVGTELAGEIAHFMPETSVTLISDDDALFHTVKGPLGRKLEAKLKDMGVTLILGQRVENLADTRKPYEGGVVLTDGTEIDADLVIPAIGSRPNSDLIKDLPDAEIRRSGQAKVDAYLRPSALPNVFAAGDTIESGDAMTIVAASRQTPWLLKTLTALSEGKDLTALKPYTPWKSAPILVPLGPERGNSFLGIATFGDWVTRKMKGEALFIPKYRKLLGRKA